MDKKSEDVLIANRKRVHQTLKKRDLAMAERDDYERRKTQNRKMIEDYSQELTLLAEQNGLLAAVEKFANQKDGEYRSNMRFHIHQGFSTCCIDPSLLEPEIGELRPSFLSFKIWWPQDEDYKEIELKMDRRGWINFQHQLISTPPFVWRRAMPESLDRLIAAAATRAADRPAPKGL